MSGFGSPKYTISSPPSASRIASATCLVFPVRLLYMIAIFFPLICALLRPLCHPTAYDLFTGLPSIHPVKSASRADSSPGSGVFLCPPLLEHSWQVSEPAFASFLPNRQAVSSGPDELSVEPPLARYTPSAYSFCLHNFWFYILFHFPALLPNYKLQLKPVPYSPDCCCFAAQALISVQLRCGAPALHTFNILTL